jgi:hypothetical protein
MAIGYQYHITKANLVSSWAACHLECHSTEGLHPRGGRGTQKYTKIFFLNQKKVLWVAIRKDPDFLVGSEIIVSKSDSGQRWEFLFFKHNDTSI